MTIDDARTLFAYDRWATTQLLDAALSVSPEVVARPIGGTFGSLLGITVHMTFASWLWLERFRGGSPTRFDAEETLTSIAAVRAENDVVSDGLRAFVDGLAPEALQSSLTYRSLEGHTFTMRLEDLLQHLANHGTYHRGQIAMALRLLGADRVPSTDFAIFARLPR